jgi:hypothetical protein
MTIICNSLNSPFSTLSDPCSLTLSSANWVSPLALFRFRVSNSISGWHASYMMMRHRWSPYTEGGVNIRLLRSPLSLSRLLNFRNMLYVTVILMLQRYRIKFTPLLELWVFNPARVFWGNCDLGGRYMREIVSVAVGELYTPSFEGYYRELVTFSGC